MMKVNLTPPHPPMKSWHIYMRVVDFYNKCRYIYHDNGDPMGICHHGNWSFPPPLLVLTSFFLGGWVGMVSIQRWTAKFFSAKPKTLGDDVQGDPTLAATILSNLNNQRTPDIFPCRQLWKESRIIAGNVWGLCSFQVCLVSRLETNSKLFVWITSRALSSQEFPLLIS